MRYINVSAEEDIYQIQEKVLDKQYEQLDKEYTVDDFVMVRATDYLAEDFIIKSVSNIPFVIKINNIAHNAIFQLLKEKNNVNLYNEEEADKLYELCNLFSPFSSQYRSTIHFTLNGLVSSHNKGNFENKNFIILDRLNKHLGKDNIKSLRMEDTFVKDSFNLSDECIVLIKKDRFKELFEMYPWLESYNIVLYEGNGKLAVETILLEMGITPENIETNSAEYSERTPYYEKSLSNIATYYGIEREKHFYSKEYKEDDQNNLKLWNIYDRYFYEQLFDYFQVEKSKAKNLIEFLLSDHTIKNKEEKLKEFILKVGINNYCEFVVKYNRDILALVNEGLLPNNNEILEKGKINLEKSKKL